MHLDDRTIDELGTVALEMVARRHMDECAFCQARAAQLDDIRRSLTLIDHPVPTIDVNTLVARARQRRAPVLIAGAGALLAAALAAALPSSPVHRAIARVLHRHHSAPTIQRAAVTRGGNSIAIQLHDAAARVMFRSRQTAGTVSIAADTGHALRITQIDGESVGYAVLPSGVKIDNAGSVASYEVGVPAGVRVLILVGTDTVFVTGPEHTAPRVIGLAAP